MDIGRHVNQEQPHEDNVPDMERSVRESTMKLQSKNAHQDLSSEFLEG